MALLIIFQAIIFTAIVTVVGGGLFYLIWVRSRPKKETWDAFVYQLGDGVIDVKRDQNGQVVSDLKLQNLIPYSIDIVEKLEKDYGIWIYRLQKLDKITPPVEAGCVEYWGEGKRYLAVLIDQGTPTILKKAYDKKTGNIIFQPMPQSRINLIKNEIVLRKERLNKEKDILNAITPWVVAGICMMALVAISWVMIKGLLEINKTSNEAAKYLIDQQIEIEKAQNGVVPPSNPVGAQLKQTKIYKELIPMNWIEAKDPGGF